MKKTKKILLSSVTLFIFGACGSSKEQHINNTSLDIPSISSSFKNSYLNVINSVRSRNQTCGSKGYFPATTDLHWSEKLYGAAYEHSNDMATTNTFSHNGSGEVSDRVGRENGNISSSRERINAYGYHWVRYAENIGAGTDIDTIEKSVAQLLASDGHCANIMNPRLSEVGIAMVKNSNSQYRYYWTQSFGTPKNE